MTDKTVCILGGGIGGVIAANLLAKSVGSKARVVLIDKNPDHVFAPSFLWVLTGQRSPKQIKRSLERLRKKGVDFINAEVEKILPEQNKVQAGGQEIDYDYLVVALGAVSNMSAVEGLNEAAINLYSLDGIIKLKQELESFAGGEIVILIPSKPYKCPAAPYETALLLDAVFRKRNMRDKVNISIYTFEPAPMGAAGPKVGQAVIDLIERHNINYQRQVTIKNISPAKKEVIFENGSGKTADLLITIPPHKAPNLLKEASLTNEAGWVPVDRESLKTKYENIFAIGDVAAVKLEGKYKPDKPLMLPKAGVFAHNEAEVVAKNIASLIKKDNKQVKFDGHGSCFLEVGDGTAAFAEGNFFAVPHPEVSMKGPSRLYHQEKVLYEKYWFIRWF